ncbi:GNAT family N-acetyltransferase [Amycolatopsis sp. NPDC089917]|uniref:GNAT family N-acetyltransferase n=1 Tax=Amycolatopsis sp. NPDC089917 TaxID=3155187 RepID=UPI003418FE0F
MEIRKALTSDAHAVTPLLAQLGYPDNQPEDVRRRLERWAGHPEGAAFVAVSGDGVIGVIAVVAIPLLERDGAVGRIVALVVDENQRRTGVARELIAVAEEQALRWGCRAMEVSSSRRRIAAHALYRAHGYEDRCERSAKFYRELTA